MKKAILILVVLLSSTILVKAQKSQFQGPEFHLAKEIIFWSPLTIEKPPLGELTLEELAKHPRVIYDYDGIECTVDSIKMLKDFYAVGVDYKDPSLGGFTLWFLIEKKYEPKTYRLRKNSLFYQSIEELYSNPLTYKLVYVYSVGGENGFFGQLCKNYEESIKMERYCVKDFYSFKNIKSFLEFRFGKGLERNKRIRENVWKIKSN